MPVLNHVSMADFIQFCNKLSLLDIESTDSLLKYANKKTFDKGDYLLKADEVCKRLYFIEEGLIKIFFYRDEKEFIMRFFHENEIFTVLDSYLTQKPSSYLIRALEPTVVTYINRADLEYLCKKHHCIETFFRNLVSMASVNMTKRISEMLEENATNRYNNFIKDNHTVLQRISLGDLASYIGITQVSLSRIRAGK